jgi:uncharacterized DUF497 family protein
MRYLFAALVIAGAAFGTAAQAETRVFIISNNSDGYGVDRCLATGASCGMMIATAYCQSHDYVQVASFRKIEREEISVPCPRPPAPARVTNSSPSSASARSMRAVATPTRPLPPLRGS